MGGMSGKRFASALGPHSPAIEPWSSFSMSERFTLYRGVEKTNLLAIIARPVGICLIRWISGKG